MPQALANLLRETIDREIPHLQAVTESQAALQPNGPQSWSPKQELGHLLDSALNNHLRFVNSVLSTAPVKFQTYAQNNWVNLHAYQNMSWDTIVTLWTANNRFLATLIDRIPPSALRNTGSFPGATPVTLQFLITDYVVHMQHHIDHLLRRPVVTQYPQNVQ